MGTSTIFKRFNDLHGNLSKMSKKELEEIDALHPFGEQNVTVRGWSVSMELHNGNFYPLIWWHGRLIHLKDAPRLLTNKHYNKYKGKYERFSDWTLLRVYLEAELKALDKEYKRTMAKQRRDKKRKTF